MKYQRDLHALEHLVCDHGSPCVDPSWRQIAQNHWKRIWTQHLNQSAAKDTALSTREDPDQTMDEFRFIAAHKSTMNYVESTFLEELDPSK